MITTKPKLDALKRLALAFALWCGLIGATTSAQTIIEVAGDGVIGDEILTTDAGVATVPAAGVTFTATGGEGFSSTSLNSPAVEVLNTGAVTLTFDHRYFIEAEWDGGAVFKSVNGGEYAYVPIGDFASTLTDYDGDTLANAGSAWPDGENVFYGKSADYDSTTSNLIQSVVNLGPLTAGDTVSVQFRVQWDGAYFEPDINWEMATVQIADTGATLLDVDFVADGSSGFTVENVNGPVGPWTYPRPINTFEADIDTTTADRYAPDIAGTTTTIDLNGAAIAIEILTGTLDIGDTITIFDLSGGTTLTGSFSSVTLPPGQWDISTLETDGTITCLDASLPLIYEGFEDLDPTLNGNTAGLGLDGTWGPGESRVEDGSLNYGRLAYRGGRAVTNPGDQFDVNGVSPGTTLTDAGLMDDGATLWFSVLIVKHANTSPATNDRRTYFSLGTGAPDGFDRIGDTPGSGFTVAVNKNSNAIQARGWNDGSDGAGGAFGGALDTSVPEGDTFLAVGKITWGEFGSTIKDTFELYLPDLDLNLGSPVSTLLADFDQLGTVNPDNAFDTIGFAGGRPDNNVPEIDEIRFAATSANVLPLDFVVPVLVSTDNASGSGIARVATFDEFVYAGTGDIRIVNETNPATTTITLPDSQVVFSGNTLTITPTVPLTAEDTYHIEIDAGAVEDRNENAFAGISDPATWTFTVDGTPPTVASFGDNTSPNPILINTSGRLVYTVTFSEPMDAGTITTADFAPTAGSASATVDSVSATNDPAVYEVAVSTGGSTGTLTLEIVAGTEIKDLSGNALVTTTAIPSDNTITVNDPTPNTGSITNDFQGTISSQQNGLNQGGNGRYFHVSVNPDNPGTGWWCADLPNSGDPAPSGWRNFTGPVVAYKFLGTTDNSVSGVAASGGEDDRITFTSEDASFDGFDQQTMWLWTTNDPGADLATGSGPAATGWAKPSYGYRNLQQLEGFIDISGLASGSVHIYYGAYNNAPSIKVTLHDSDNVGADIVIADVHSVDDGGTGDSANAGEQYLAEIDFVTDGVYDVLEYEFTSGNGNGGGVVLTGPDVFTDDYSLWATMFPDADLSDPNGDFDGDGMTNNEERLFGTDPTDAASLHQFPSGLFASTTSTFSFTRRDNALTGLFSDIETSFDLQMWTEDIGAVLVEGTVDGSTNVEIVDVTLSPGLLTAPKLFVRVNQNEGVFISENFEADNGGFTVVTTAGTDWEHGAPDSVGELGGSVTEGNGGSTNCWGTNLGDFSSTTSPTPEQRGYFAESTVTSLRSTVIDLTGVSAAELLFAEALDIEAGDTAVVNIIDDVNDTVISSAIYTADDSASTGDANWNNVAPIPIPAGALGQAVRIEWRFTGFGGGTDDYLGWYIDDVTVRRAMP